MEAGFLTQYFLLCFVPVFMSKKARLVWWTFLKFHHNVKLCWVSPLACFTAHSLPIQDRFLWSSSGSLNSEAQYCFHGSPQTIGISSPKWIFRYSLPSQSEHLMRNHMRNSVPYSSFLTSLNPRGVFLWRSSKIWDRLTEHSATKLLPLLVMLSATMVFFSSTLKVGRCLYYFCTSCHSCSSRNARF